MLKAIIFDCDGVIADTEPLHFATLQAVLEEEGMALSREEYDRNYLALDDRNCFARAYRDRGATLSEEKLAELIARKAASVEPLLRGHLRVFPGVVELVHTASKRYPLAVASGALRHEVELVLQHAGVREMFQVVVTAEDVSNGKPHPESFLKACSLLNADRADRFGAGECLVIEDSIHGVRAARDAGMHCLAVTNSYSREHLKAADRVVTGLDELSLREMEALF